MFKDIYKHKKKILIIHQLNNIKNKLYKQDYKYKNIHKNIFVDKYKKLNI